MTANGPLEPLVRLIALLACCVAGCGDSSATSSADSPVRGVANSRSAAPMDVLNPVVRIETNQGAVTLKLDAASAPGTVRNFLNYVGEGFYNNTIVHYVDPGKMILAGGYTSERQPKPPLAPIRSEAHNGRKNVRGTIAMTRDPALVDSATSQFFINLADAPQRDHQGDAPDQYGYCVFGEVTEGLDIAERISESPTTNLSGDLASTPDPPVIITTIRRVR